MNLFNTRTNSNTPLTAKNIQVDFSKLNIPINICHGTIGKSVGCCGIYIHKHGPPNK